MPYVCKNCGGDLKSDGKSLKCVCCGSKFASESELGPQIKAEPILNPSAESKNPPKQDKEKKKGIFSNFGVGKKKEELERVVGGGKDDGDFIKGGLPLGSGDFNNPERVDKAERSEQNNAAQKSNQGVNVFEDNQNGVLEITWSDAQYLHSGSGFLVSGKGYAITNTHVVTSEDGRSCGTVNVRICGENVKADVIKLGDSRHGLGSGVDLAIIKLNRVPQNAKVVEIEDFGNVKIGEQVFVIGNSLGLGTCITSGIVSDKLRNVNGKMLLMTDCAVNGGNSGGPIFNAQGRVIGAIVSGIDSAEGMNFAIPSSTVIEFMTSDSSLYSLMGVTCPSCDKTNTSTDGNAGYCHGCHSEFQVGGPTFGKKQS